MSKFFSLTSDGKGNICYFDWELRKKCLSREIKADPDNHTSINDYFGYKGAAGANRNKYKYNPLTKVFTVDMINTTDDKELVKAKVMELDFKKIVEPLIVKPIINPLLIANKAIVTDKVVGKLREWVSVRDSVRAFVWGAVRASMGDAVWASVRTSVWVLVWKSVRNPVCFSVENLAWASVENSVCFSMEDSAWAVRVSVGKSVLESMQAYTSSFFNIKKWEYIDHEPFKNPFQCLIDLWEMGFVPSYDGKVWRLHQGVNAEIVYEMSDITEGGKDKL